MSTSKKTAPAMRKKKGAKGESVSRATRHAESGRVNADKIAAVRAAMDHQHMDHSGWSDAALLARHDHLTSAVVTFKDEHGGTAAMTELELWTNYTFGRRGRMAQGKPGVVITGLDLNASPPTATYETYRLGAAPTRTG